MKTIHFILDSRYDYADTTVFYLWTPAQSRDGDIDFRFYEIMHINVHKIVCNFWYGLQNMHRYGYEY